MYVFTASSHGHMDEGSGWTETGYQSLTAQEVKYLQDKYNEYITTYCSNDATIMILNIEVNNFNDRYLNDIIIKSCPKTDNTNMFGHGYNNIYENKYIYSSRDDIENIEYGMCLDNLDNDITFDFSEENIKYADITTLYHSLRNNNVEYTEKLLEYWYNDNVNGLKQLLEYFIETFFKHIKYLFHTFNAKEIEDNESFPYHTHFNVLDIKENIKNMSDDIKKQIQYHNNCSHICQFIKIQQYTSDTFKVICKYIVTINAINDIFYLELRNQLKYTSTCNSAIIINLQSFVKDVSRVTPEIYDFITSQIICDNDTRLYIDLYAKGFTLVKTKRYNALTYPKGTLIPFTKDLLTLNLNISEHLKKGLYDCNFDDSDSDSDSDETTNNNVDNDNERTIKDIISNYPEYYIKIPHGTWINTAKNVSIIDNILTCDLQTNIGNWNTINICVNLKEHYKNNNGQLEHEYHIRNYDNEWYKNYPHGTWMDSAKDIVFENGILSALLLTQSSEWVFDSIDLKDWEYYKNQNDYYANDNGKFVKGYSVDEYSRKKQEKQNLCSYNKDKLITYNMFNTCNIDDDSIDE